MEISKKSILKKTHYGLNIYAHVLRQYYSGETVLSLSGRDCKPAKNPFNEDKPTLMIKVVDNCARHTDKDKAIESGDVFDFAALHFGLSGQKLNEKLNEALHLHIGEKTGFYDKPVPQLPILPPEREIMEPPTFSYFKKPISNVQPYKKTDLAEVYNKIKSKEFAEHTNALRNLDDPKKTRKYKATHFDYATFSGIFSRRNDKNLEKHSGLLTLDFDHIVEIDILKSLLLEDEYFETELMFVSPSGNGLKWIVPIDLEKATHQDYFKAVANYLLRTYQLEVDQSGKDISRACFLPYDPDVFINPKYVE
ncbi:MAG TPA: BT4734/BF3469 family protein [Flavobacteriaceae bacterium]|nr:BT4734/BF3469 family protein [Flavobacteriaceae bacterium]